MKNRPVFGALVLILVSLIGVVVLRPDKQKKQENALPAKTTTADHLPGLKTEVTAWMQKADFLTKPAQTPIIQNQWTLEPEWDCTIPHHQALFSGNGSMLALLEQKAAADSIVVTAIDLTTRHFRRCVLEPVRDAEHGLLSVRLDQCEEHALNLRAYSYQIRWDLLTQQISIGTAGEQKIPSPALEKRSPKGTMTLRWRSQSNRPGDDVRLLQIMKDGKEVWRKDMEDQPKSAFLSDDMLALFTTTWTGKKRLLNVIVINAEGKEEFFAALEGQSVIAHRAIESQVHILTSTKEDERRTSTIWNLSRKK